MLGQWNLPWRPRWMIYADDALGWSIARLLPRAAVKWALRRAAAHATGGRWNAKDAIALTAMQVSRRWRIAT